MTTILWGLLALILAALLLGTGLEALRKFLERMFRS
ncbi:dsRNA-specific ribonuclease [Bradyrhizobium yuanmingense]